MGRAPTTRIGPICLSRRAIEEPTNGRRSHSAAGGGHPRLPFPSRPLRLWRRLPGLHRVASLFLLAPHFCLSIYVCMLSIHMSNSLWLSIYTLYKVVIIYVICLCFLWQSQALGWLLSAPGASNTVLEVVVPYSRTSMAQLLGRVPTPSPCID